MMGIFSPYKLWGATVKGPSHKKKNLPNQDSFLYKYYSWGELAVVSDGLGSKKHSDFGSRMACKAIQLEIERWDKTEPINMEEFTTQIHTRWLELVGLKGAKNCGTTCLFCIRIFDTVYLGQLGDGMILIIDKDKLVLNMEDPKGESFSNLTSALSTSHNPNLWKFTKFSTSDFSTIFLCTDGISEDLLSHLKLKFAIELVDHYGSIIFPIYRTFTLRKMMTNWPVPHHNDDKTIVALHLRDIK